MYRTRRYVRVALMGVFCVAALISAAAVQGETTERIPFGRYDGSAAGGDAAPFPITVWIAAGEKGDEVEVTVRTSQVPVPIVERRTAARAGAGWDIPLSVSVSFPRLEGDGVVRLRPGEGDWVIYGEGTGSFWGAGGSGRGYGERVSAKAGVLGQVVDGLKALAAGPPVEEDAAPAPKPYVEEPSGGRAEPAGVSAEASRADPPPSGPTTAALLLVLTLVLVIGLF